MKGALLSRKLPKWPQMLVTGVPVTKKQALEIIRRTDTFFTCGYDGNNNDWNKTVRVMVGLPKEEWWRVKNEDAAKFDKKRRDWKKKWGCVYTDYVHNSWVSCAFIFGAHGWCHPDGTIGFVDNVGKWPTVEEVYNDWCLLARTFKFLKVAVTLMDGEQGEDEKKPVVSMVIEKGKVRLVDPYDYNVHIEHKAPKERDFEDSTLILGTGGEIGISKDVIQDWVKEQKRKQAKRRAKCLTKS